MSIRQMDLNPKTFHEIQIPRLSNNLLSGMHPTNMHTALDFLLVLYVSLNMKQLHTKTLLS